MSTSKHPKGLYLVFATSTAERFSYYGMRAIFILFLTQALLFDKEHAASIYGSYTGLVYLTPLIGGYIADKYWGIRRSVFWGAMMMAVGQFLMFFSASMLDTKELSHWLMYGGLTFLILGNGCFKPTVSSLVGQLYEPGDRRLDSAYTIFYMGVNVGSFFAPLVCGYFGETGDPNDFKWGFLIAAIVTVFTVILFETQKSKYLIGPDGKPLGIIPDAKREQPKEHKTVQQTAIDKDKKMRNNLLLGALTIALALFFYWCFGNDWVSIGIFTACIIFPVSILVDGSLTKIERDRIFVIYIIAFFVIFFWAAYEQAGASLTLFAAEQTDRTIFGWEMPASWIQSFNPFFVVILAANYAQCMGCAEQTRHGAGFPHQTSYRFAAALTGIFSHLFRCERCTARCKSQPYLANRTLFHPYYGRNSPLSYRLIHGKQTHPCPFCLSHDGNLVSFHLYSQ